MALFALNIFVLLCFTTQIWAGPIETSPSVENVVKLTPFHVLRLVKDLEQLMRLRVAHIRTEEDAEKGQTLSFYEQILLNLVPNTERSVFLKKVELDADAQCQLAHHCVELLSQVIVRRKWAIKYFEHVNKMNNEKVKIEKQIGLEDFDMELQQLLGSMASQQLCAGGWSSSKAPKLPAYAIDWNVESALLF